MTGSLSTKVKDHMKNHIFKIDQNELLQNAAANMIQNKIGALIVMENSKAVGMVTERDILRAFVAKSEHSPVKDFMSAPLITIDGNSVLGKITQLMSSKKIRRLPVTNQDGEIVGFFNLRDLMAAIHNSFITLFEA
ncbi:MAG: CBS domain-containing protein [Candidatus Kariarchaeaceae archaeon]|jgi:predicted transcriptional regulator